MLTVSIGPLSLSLAQLLLLSAFVIALIVGAITGRKEGVPIAGTLSDIFLAALVAARIGFVAQYFEHYRDNLWGIIDIRDGGFSVIAGLAGAMALIAWKLWRQPKIRRSLTIASASGLLVWGSVSLLVTLMESSSRGLPQTTFTLLDGSPVALAEVADDKPMVVNLWASWCPPCIREMPVLEKAQQDNPDITFVYVNQGEQPETIIRFMSQHKLSLQNVLTDTSASLGRTTGSQALPTTLFYDANGQQVNAHLGELSRASLAHNLRSFNTD
ncbi:MAG: TlpA family protein disulfide reductase [Marinobacter sp.]|nr:TlpA disulfide reductase family protein [Marinobacter sp.]MBQ0746253.1 TlpA family protein disulfide reductase [Marinobacter sp.]MBQ0813599.1 TlpA family protein disulfide reductase [Marinobacter sp.]|tara:strand:- start:405 stop:1217 length:813 start_codon:yes stop_codon:yes gene_type:complete